MSEVYGRLTFIREAGRSKGGFILWECSCSCGNIKTYNKPHIVNGNTQSCGCLRKERRTKHGLSKHSAYQAFKAAKSRCTNIKCSQYKDYGGRGVEFRLGNFEEFIERMLPTWVEGLSIDRIDNNGHYEYGNVQWATSKEQCMNRRSNIMITYNMVTLNISNWAKELGMTHANFAYRIKHWGIERAITTPPRKVQTNG